MAKLFCIAGHGAGDSGAVGGGYTEAALVRKLAMRIKALGGSDVQIGDMSVNWFDTEGISRLPKGTNILELHMDSFANASAKGGSVRIKPGFSPDSDDKALAAFISSMFPGRSQPIWNQPIKNANLAAARGCPYRLLECCFISNADDRTKFINQMDELAHGILAAFGISAGAAPSPEPSPAPEPPAGGTTGEGFGGTYVCQADGCRVRTSPSLSASVVAHYDKGMTVAIDDWYVSRDGWIWGRYTGATSGQKRYIAIGKATGKVEADDLWLKQGSEPSVSKPSGIRVGYKVRVTKPYDVNGTHLAVSGTYDVIQVDGDRVVIGRGGVVTAAVSAANLQLA